MVGATSYQGFLAIIIRPHRMAHQCVDASYSYRCLYVAWSVYLPVGHDRKPYKKTAKPIEMPFGMLTRVGQVTVLDEVHTGATWQTGLNKQSRRRYGQ